MRLISCLALSLLCLSCSTADTSRTAAAVTTPLGDLNLLKGEIPEALQAALRAPYEMPAARDCAALAAQIQVLDEVLGPDIDAPASEAHRGLLERGADEATGAAVGAVQRTAEGIIPFRSWIRKLSGAERQSRRVAAAITAGGVRRAFLKGLRAPLGCTP